MIRDILADTKHLEHGESIWRFEHFASLKNIIRRAEQQSKKNQSCGQISPFGTLINCCLDRNIKLLLIAINVYMLHVIL